MKDRKIFVHKYIDAPIIDEKINGKSWMTSMTVKEYLHMVDVDGNEYQRNLQSLSFYKKLINDLLNNTTMPPISVVYPDTNIDFKSGLNINKKFIVLDGLQRTNCLLECLSILERGMSTGVYKSKEEFYKKIIYVEIWENLDIKSILYKMLILNTGQKKMDYKHQLDILGDSMKPMLDKKGIKYYTLNENKSGEDIYPLSLIVSGFVSLVGQKPIKQKKNAAEYLFNKFDIDVKSNEEDTTLNLISDEETYNYLKWVLVDFNNLLTEKYHENNPLSKYEVFMNALLGSIGHCHIKKPENLKGKIKILQDSFSKSDDPIKLDKFEVIYKGFKTGIGDKRRNFIFGSFRNYFLAPEYVEFDWDEDYAQL